MPIHPRMQYTVPTRGDVVMGRTTSMRPGVPDPQPASPQRAIPSSRKRCGMLIQRQSVPKLVMLALPKIGERPRVVRGEYTAGFGVNKEPSARETRRRAAGYRLGREL